MTYYNQLNGLNSKECPVTKQTNTVSNFLKHLEKATANPDASLLRNAGLVFLTPVKKTLAIEAEKQSEALAKINPGPLANEFNHVKDFPFSHLTSELFEEDSTDYSKAFAMLYHTPPKNTASLHSDFPDFSEIFAKLYEIEILEQTIIEKQEKQTEKATTAEFNEIKIRAKQFDRKAVNAVTIGFLAAMTLVLTVVTHGAFAESGATLFEALSRIDELSSKNNLTQNALDNIILNNQNTLENLLKTDMTKEYDDKLYKDWSTLIETHCRAQRASLQEIKKYLIEETEQDKSILSQIDQFDKIYEKELAELQATQKEIPENRIDQIKQIAVRISAVEQDKIIPFSKKIKEELPVPTHSAADKLFSRAKDFYHKNKKMFQLAGLITLASVGIALTVATGGIAGVLGAAALGSVIVSPIKSFFQYQHGATDFISETKRLETHANQQKESLNKIEKETSGETYTALEYERKQYEQTEETLHRLHNNPPQSSVEKNQALTENAKTLEKLDSKTTKLLTEKTAELSDTAKNESKGFVARAKSFFQRNKETLHFASKVALGVAALSILIVTGGTAAGVAAGFAIGAAAASYAVKKITKKIASRQSNDKDEDEGEGESKKKLETPHAQ